LIEPRALACGATALFERVEGTKAASIGLWFPFGSRVEGPLVRGATHFIEHMLFKGTSSRGARSIAQEIDRLGGYMNAFTERECVCLFCTLPGESLGTAIEVLCDMAFRSTFPEDEFEREKTVIVSEIMASMDDPEDVSFDGYLESAWPGSELSRKITGEAKEIAPLGRNALLQYFERMFVPEAAIISIAGAFDPDETAALLSKNLETARRGSKASGTIPFAGEAPVFSAGASRKTARIQQVHFYSGMPMDFSRTNAEYNAISVFNCAFGESMSSRLFQNIREKLGYCYSIYSFFSLASDAGLFTVCGSSSPESFADMTGAVGREIDSLSNGGLSDAEIDDSLSHLAGSSILASEDMETRMKRLARQYLFNREVLSSDELIAALRATAREDVREIAARVALTKERRLYAYGARFKDKAIKWKKTA
jgi:predicted Zn-dependent peptidase